MTCAKQQVICRIHLESGQTVKGENWCRNPQSVCPRDEAGYGTGEGYHLCKEICDQIGHAEADAVREAKKRGVKKALWAGLEGHTYACNDCVQKLQSVGVMILRIDNRDYDITRRNTTI